MGRVLAAVEPHQIATVKRELPDVVMKWAGKTWRARVSGRLNQFASVSPYQDLHERGKLVTTYILPVFHFSWEAVVRAYLYHQPLST